MNKKISKVIFIVIIILIIIGFAVAAGIYMENQKVQSRQKEQQLRLETYSKSLHISGDFKIEDNQVVISNREYDEFGMIQDIALYNTFYKEDVITIEMLMAEYELFCAGMERSELIELYRERMMDIDNRAEKIGRHAHGYDYERYIIKYLKDTYNKGLSDATKEEMMEACPYGAEQFYNEIVNKENAE